MASLCSAGTEKATDHYPQGNTDNVQRVSLLPSRRQTLTEERSSTPIEEERMKTVKSPGSSRRNIANWFSPEQNGANPMHLQAASSSASGVPTVAARINIERPKRPFNMHKAGTGRVTNHHFHGKSSHVQPYTPQKFSAEVAILQNQNQNLTLQRHKHSIETFRSQACNEREREQHIATKESLEHESLMHKSTQERETQLKKRLAQVTKQRTQSDKLRADAEAERIRVEELLAYIIGHNDRLALEMTAMKESLSLALSW